MNARLAIVGSLALGVACGAIATADPATQYYTPPHLIKQGTATTSPAGNGIVVIQVLVNTDGTFKVQRIVKSSNHGDDQAAMEMANSAQYAPATKGDQKIKAFYTYTLKFVGGQTSASDSTSGGTLAQYNAQVRSGKYADAKAGLTTYLQAHPGDQGASALLGVADTFTDDYTGAAAAFDKAGTVPQQYKAVAARAYAGAAEKAITVKDATAAVNAARRANELSPGVATLNLVGNAQIVAGDYAGAARSFESARSQAAGDAKVTSAQKATIVGNLVSAYVNLDQPDKAISLLPEVKQYDPGNTNAEASVVGYYATKAQAAQRAGNTADATAYYEKAAAIGNTYAPLMYTNEAIAYSKAPKPDWKAVKAAADRALALKPDSAEANYIAGIALANDGKGKDAIPYLQKASATARAAGDKALADNADLALSKLNSGK